jgi:hypothetical protein
LVNGLAKTVGQAGVRCSSVAATARAAHGGERSRHRQPAAFDIPLEAASAALPGGSINDFS